MIRELCPDGAEYVKLNSVCDIYDGTHSTPNYTESGVKFASVENIGNLYATQKYISEKDFEKYKIKPRIGDVMMTRIGSVGVCTVVDRNEALAFYVSLALLRPQLDKVQSRFLKYAIESIHGRKELRKRTLINAVPIKINKDDIGKVTIPLPPIEIQSEIVRILDNFTNLTAELTAELTARKKQYNYYRDQLLGFDGQDIEWKPLGDMIKSLKTGLNPRKNFQLNTSDAENFYVTVREIQNGNIVFVQQTDRINKRALELINNRSNLEVGDVLFSGTGTVGRTAVISIKPENWNIKEGVYVIKPNQDILNSRFLAHILNASHIVKEYSKKIVGSPVVSLPMSELKKILIPIPSPEEQKRIVSILDKFDTLTASISEGLPKEIELRQKQYEYYRDMLLTFPTENLKA